MRLFVGVTPFNTQSGSPLLQGGLSFAPRRTFNNSTTHRSSFQGRLGWAGGRTLFSPHRTETPWEPSTRVEGFSFVPDPSCLSSPPTPPPPPRPPPFPLSHPTGASINGGCFHQRLVVKEAAVWALNGGLLSLARLPPLWPTDEMFPSKAADKGIKPRFTEAHHWLKHQRCRGRVLLLLRPISRA